MATPGAAPQLCPDWVLSHGSNVHVARDRAWFSTYTPFPTFTTSFPHSERDPREVLGVGDVDLRVHLFPDFSGLEAHGTLHLQNVLHIPTSACNVIGRYRNPDADGWSYTVLPGLGGNYWAITDQNGRRLGYMLDRYFPVLKLSQPPTGPGVGPYMGILDGPRRPYLITALWPDSERERWAAAQAGSLNLNQGTEQTAPNGGKEMDTAEAAQPATYSDGEKASLEMGCGSEFESIADSELSMDEDGDSGEGKRSARAMIGDDEDGWYHV